MSTICQFIVAHWVTGHIVESSNCLACIVTSNRVCLVFLKEYVFTLTIKWVSSDMLPPGAIAYFVLNLELTHLSLTAHTLLCLFLSNCFYCVHAEYEDWAFHLGLSCHFVLIPLSLFLLIFFLCPVAKFRLVIRKKCSSGEEWSSGAGCTEIVQSPVLEVFRDCPDKTISKPVWFWCWPFFEQEAGLCDL